MRRLCTVCVRSGSKGVPGKNLRSLLGKPLLAHSILQAKQSGLFEAVAVSSDGEALLRSAREWGADFCIPRPLSLASDSAPKIPAIRHCLTEAEKLAGHEFDLIADLDATAPLRLVSDISGAVALLEDTGAPNVVTGAAARHSPYFNLVEIGEGGTVRLCKSPDAPVFCRQSSPKCYDLNGSVYVWRRESLLKCRSVLEEGTRLFEMPPERAADIDSELDFEFVAYLMKKRAGPQESDVL
ncbi:acylneuraminate cytidylyltransferase family protein [Caproicibacter sp. BJN0012]|uniref:acylneuraminate cytidylyltransferase family protein n=1 Tax=Caproicibacter sp. BJN0012 TaxID=3110227 RepID=UPI002E1532FA